MKRLLKSASWLKHGQAAVDWVIDPGSEAFLSDDDYNAMTAKLIQPGSDADKGMLHLQSATEMFAKYSKIYFFVEAYQGAFAA